MAAPQSPSKNLPDETIFYEILPRIPAKSLLQCRCVCKTWCNTISSNPHFIKTHLHYWTSKSPGILKQPKKDQYIYHNEETGEEFDLKLNQMMNEKHTFLLPFTSCYGLMLVQCIRRTNPKSSPYFYVCNPITRQFLRLAPSPFWLNPSEIAYDGVGDKYKVVSWSSIQGVAIFTLGDLGKDDVLWRIIPNPVGVYDMFTRAVSVNGCLYWVSMTLDGMYYSYHQCTTLISCIMCLDIHTEEVKKITMPDEYHDRPPVLVEVRGVLYAVFDSEHDLENFVIWVLDDWKNYTWKKILRCSDTSSLYGSVHRIVSKNKLILRCGIMPVTVREVNNDSFFIDHVNTLVSWDGNAFRKKRKWISRRCLKIFCCFLVSAVLYLLYFL